MVSLQIIPPSIFLICTSIFLLNKCYAMKRISILSIYSLLISTVLLTSCLEDELPIPEPPTNLVATTSSSSQIDLIWSDNSDSEDGFKIERKLGSGEFAVIATSGKDVSVYSDKNLEENTTYTYRIFGFNSTHETGEYSNESSATTNSVPQLTTTVISLITASTATSGGAITLVGGTPITENGVVWSTSPNPTIDLATKTSNDTGSSSFGSNIIDLNWETEYYVRAYATNSTGTGYGDEVVFTTGPISITTTTISDISPFAGLSGGSIGIDAGSAVTARGIVWSINPSPTVDLDTKTIDGNGTGSFTSNVTGLNWETEYYVRSYATSSSGTSYGDEMSFTTQSLIISTEPVMDITSNSGISGGSIDGEGGTSILARGVVWSIDPDPTITSSSKTEDGTGAGNFTSLMTALVPNTTYYLRTYVSNNATTSYGPQINFTTTQLTDTDGNIYAAVQIGSQVWMAENLRTTTLNDGTDIPNITDLTEWSALETSSYDYYHDGDYLDKELNGSIYGGIYNWNTVKNGMVCPTGWHVPSLVEWETLIDFLGGGDNAAYKLMESGIIHWDAPNTNANNESGFTALPGGVLVIEDPIYEYYDLGKAGFWWSSTEDPNSMNRAMNVDMTVNRDFEGSMLFRYIGNSKPKEFGLSIRCISD